MAEVLQPTAVNSSSLDIYSHPTVFTDPIAHIQYFGQGNSCSLTFKFTVDNATTFSTSGHSWGVELEVHNPDPDEPSTQYYTFWSTDTSAPPGVFESASSGEIDVTIPIAANTFTQDAQGHYYYDTQLQINYASSDNTTVSGTIYNGCGSQTEADPIDLGGDLIGDGEATGSPLVMDLSAGGTGISLSSVSSDPVYWDIATEGVRHASGWTSGDTGLLCIDLNADGIINDNSELFGNQPSSGTANGFQALSAYDSNSDGHITSSDAEFGDLRVWLDANHDGISQANELYSLSSLNITDIDLGYSSVNYAISGNTIKQESTFTMNGDTRTIADAWFAYDGANTIYDGTFTIDPDTVGLPDQRGYGLLPELNIAMSGDSTLLGMVEDVAGQSLSDLFDPTYDLGSKMLAIAYEWAGVESVSSTGRGSYFDGQKLAFLEHLYDHLYWGAVGSNPGPNSQTYLDQAWPLVFGFISANILGQTAMGDLFGNPTYDVAEDALSGGTWNGDTAIQFASLGVGIGKDHILSDTGLNDIYVFQPGDSPISGSYYRIDEGVNSDTNILLLGGVDPSDVKMWDDSSGNLIVQYSSGDKVQIDGSHATGGENEAWKHVQEIAFSNDGTIWDLTSGLNLTALSNSQALYGTVHADTLTASGNYDNLYGYAGNDTLFAGPGAALQGGTGNDTYVFTSGVASTSYGGAHIYEYSGEGTDTIAFQGITPSSVQMWDNSSGELFIKYSSGDEAIIEGGSYSSTTGFTVGNVEQVTFDDVGNTTWDLTGGLNLIATANSQILYGTSSADTLTATGNYNQVYGYGGADTFVGGNGSYLYGGTGDDTYSFSAGQASTSYGGAYVYENSSEGTDTVAFHGIDPANVTMWDTTGGNLIIKYSSGDEVTIGNGSYNSTTGFTLGNVEQITFDDTGNTTWDLTGGLNLTATASSQSIYGTGYGDSLTGAGTYEQLFGFGGDDTLYGGGGNDYLYGGSGADTFVFKSATAFAGNTVMTDFSTTDGDVIDMRDVLAGHYNPSTDNIADFISFSNYFGSTRVYVDQDGTGTTDSPTLVGTLLGVTGVTVSGLITDGELLVS